MFLNLAPVVLTPVVVLLAATHLAAANAAQLGYVPGPTSPSGYLDILVPGAVGPASPDPSAAPDHIVMDEGLRDVIAEVFRRSVAFRGQWRALARSSRLELRIRLVPRGSLGQTRAATTFTTLADGALLAETAIPAASRLPELLGHELEHVLEFLDGVRVSAQHVLGDASVRRRQGTFETARAVLIGRQVSAEFYAR